MATIAERVNKIVAKQLGLPENKVNPSDNFRLDLLADDTDCRELIVAFEDEFSMDIPPDDLGKIETVQHVINYAKAHGK
jgi:acyl carrier protein